MRPFLLRGAHCSSHSPQQVIARSDSDKAISKRDCHACVPKRSPYGKVLRQTNTSACRHALWARNGTFLMAPNASYFVVLVATLFVALILAGFVSLDAAFPQAGTTEIRQQGEESSSQKEPADTQSRNPFLLPLGVYLLSREGAGPAHREKAIGKDAKLEEMETSPFKVRAILISDQIRLATIGSQIVAVGDEINGEKILEIKKDQVILGKGDKKRTLHLQQSPLRLTIEEKK